MYCVKFLQYNLWITKQLHDLETPGNDLSLDSTTVQQIQTAKPIDSPIETATKVSKRATTSQQECLAVATITTITTAEPQNQQTLQAENAKANLTKMPATKNVVNAAISSTAAAMNPPISSSSPLKERAEKFLGGHYTPQAASSNRNNTDEQERIERGEELAKKASTTSSTASLMTALSEDRSLYFSAKSSSQEDWTNEESTLSQSSASSLACNYVTVSASSVSYMSAQSMYSTISGKNNSNNAASERTESTAREANERTPTESATVTCLASSLAAGEHAVAGVDEVMEVQETETLRQPNRSGTYAASSSQQRDVMQSTTKTATATTVEKTNTKTTATGASTAAKTAQQQARQPQQNQSHSKYERERTSPTNSSNAASPTLISSTPLTPLECEKKQLQLGGKISTKLQNNQFIKNQQQLATPSGSGVAKYIRYKTYSLQESAALTNIPALRTGFSAKTPSPAPGSTTTSAAKKMVAVQEMKKTSQNASHHHRHHHHAHHQQPHPIIDASGGSCARANRQSPNEEATTFDPSEDLSYGPGIVSKLRCRYLTLALREQRHCLNTLRRATSLSNLLDRNDHKDEEDELDYEEDEEEVHHKSITQNERTGKAKNGGGGILKHTHDATNESLLNKKTTTFQKFSGAATNGLIMPASPYEDTKLSTGGGGTTPFNSSSSRSRHNKRGKDSLKRARSVEALLCEKSPWNFNALNRNSFSPTKGGQSPPLNVSIEDKIHNARTRLILGTDAMPPKRLTSIIDDNERPPREFVKQTLKMFEATANRRGRGAARTQGKGEVAHKVANYKSIIKEHKPPIMFPKPPTSPTKKLGSPVKPAAKPVGAAAADLIASPVGRKTMAAANALSKNQSPKHKLGSTVDATAVSPSKVLSAENAPDVIPRSKLLAEKRDAAQQQQQPAFFDSPVTALTRKLEKLHVDTSTHQSTGGVAAASVIKEFHARQPQSQPPQTQASKRAPESWHEKREVNNENNDVEGDKAAPVDPDRVVLLATTEHNEFAVGSGGGGGAANGSSGDKKHDRAAAVVSAEQPRHDSEQAGTADAAISSDLSDDEYGLTKRVSKAALDNISKAGTTQQFKFAGQAKKSATPTSTSTPVKSLSHEPSPQIPTSVLNASPGKQIGVIRPLPTSSNSGSPSSNSSSNSAQQQQSQSQLQQQQHMETLKQQSAYSPHSAYSAAPVVAHSLTSREIEKNRINEMKKTTALTTDNNATNAASGATSGGGSAVTTTAATAAASTSLNTVINTNATNSPLGRAATNINATSGYSELDAAAAQASSNSPLWALRKKRQTPVAATENTTMVFNFSNRKEVPDYIENDGVIFRRKRELPKPNESGFVLLTDLSLETSTDTDYDDFSMCPPSPCDVEFENANIVIDGKSSIRQKAKEATFHVQFNDTLTSTFEYPSEASLVLDDNISTTYADLENVYEKLMLEDNMDSPAYRHHHVAVDEIIQLPRHLTSSPTAANPSSSTNSPTKNMLGNLQLGSAPLGFYTPVKAPLDNLFQLGITRAPNGSSKPKILTTTTTTNGNHNGDTSIGGSIVGISEGLIGDGNGCAGDINDEPESLQYIKPANDDLTIAYSEGTQKTDLLY